MGGGKYAERIGRRGRVREWRMREVAGVGSGGRRESGEEGGLADGIRR